VLRLGEYRIMGATAVAYGALSEIWLLACRESKDLLVAFVLLLVLAVLVALVVVEQPVSGYSKEQAAMASPPSSLDIAIERYGLTPRESEIMAYLLQGRSRPYIQKKLFLSDGTIKTHTSHIYSKLDVHSRQQLLDLVEAIEEELENA